MDRTQFISTLKKKLHILVTNSNFIKIICIFSMTTMLVLPSISFANILHTVTVPVLSNSGTSFTTVNNSFMEIIDTDKINNNATKYIIKNNMIPVEREYTIEAPTQEQSLSFQLQLILMTSLVIFGIKLSRRQ